MAGKTVGDFLGKIVRDPDLSMGAKINKFIALVPVFEITASVALIYNDNPRLFQLLAHMMKTPDKFERLSGWMQDYLARLSAEFGMVGHEVLQQRSILDLFVRSAEAAGLKDAVKTIFINGLKKIDEGLDYKLIGEVAESFDEALEQLIDVVTNDNIHFVLKEVTEDTYVVKAFMNIGEFAGPDGMRRFATNGGWTLGMSEFSTEAMVESIADMRIDRIMRTKDELADALPVSYSASVKSGLKRVVSQVDHPWKFKITKGHMAHLLVVTDLMNSGKVIRGVEVYEVPIKLSNGFTLAERRIDIIIETDGLDLLWDVKANAVDKWEANLVKDMKMKVSKKADGTITEDGPGQFLTDLGKLYRDLSNDAPTAYRQRVYTPEVLGLGRKPTPAQIETMEKQMNNKVVEMIDSGNYDVELMDALGMDKKMILDGDEVEIERFNDAISDLKQMVQGSYEGSKGLKIMKIYPFDNLVPPNG
jgi:hypothetical protein